MQRVAILSRDLGDGSCATVYVLNPVENLVDLLIEHDPEAWSQNSYDPDTLTFPDDLDLVACGFKFWTYEDLFWEE